MRTVARISIAASAVVLLGGCQSFPLTSWMFKDRSAQRSQPARLAVDTTGALEEGRAQLHSGNISAAVASFRVALLDRASRAEASNGLAVAYARLGRDDLAERYFQAAIAAEPDNTKFVANLLRLQQTALARRAAASDTQLAASSAPAALAPSAAPAMAAAQRSTDTRPSLTTGPIVRVSRNEVRVHGAGSGNAPAMSVAYRETPRAPAAPAAETESARRVAALALPPETAREVENPFARGTAASGARGSEQ